MVPPVPTLQRQSQSQLPRRQTRAWNGEIKRRRYAAGACEVDRTKTNEYTDMTLKCALCMLKALVYHLVLAPSTAPTLQIQEPGRVP